MAEVNSSRCPPRRRNIRVLVWGMSLMKRSREARTVQVMNDYTLAHPHPAFATSRHVRPRPRPCPSRPRLQTIDPGGMTLAERLRAHAAFAALWSGVLVAWIAS